MVYTPVVRDCTILRDVARVLTITNTFFWLDLSMHSMWRKGVLANSGLFIQNAIHAACQTAEMCLWKNVII